MMTPETVSFHIQHSKFQLRQRKALRAWLIRCVRKEDCSVSELNYQFCSDAHMLEANRTFLDHDYLTDILTFPGHSSHGIAGDILISIDRIRENAREHQETAHRELLRVMAHGALHLIGYDDKTPENQREMRIAEDRWISLWEQNTP